MQFLLKQSSFSINRAKDKLKQKVTDCDHDFLVDLGPRAKELASNYELSSVEGVDNETVTYCFKTKELLNEWLLEKTEIDGNTVEAVKRDHENAKRSDFKNMKKSVIQMNLFNAKWGLEMMGSQMKLARESVCTACIRKHPNTDLRTMLTRGKGWKEGDHFVGNVAKTLKIKHVPPSKK